MVWQAGSPSPENMLLLPKQRSSFFTVCLGGIPAKYFFLFGVLGKGSRRGKEGKRVCSPSGGKNRVPARGVLIQRNILRTIWRTKYVNTDSPFLCV